jgi:hypothetical protein
MNTLIASASSTFNTELGFDLSSVVAYVFVQLKTILGFGLYIVQTNLPVLLTIVAVSAALGFLYKMGSWLHLWGGR